MEKKAVFLDRDGVINKERGDYTYRIEDFIINEGLIEGLKDLLNKGYLLIVITNQGGIARSRYTHNEVHEIHQFLLNKLKNHHIEITEILYCPHHDEISQCLCRKPGSLMFEKALAKHQIDASKSYMIGDSDRDIIAAEKAGIKGIKVEPNQNILNICKSID